jgi:hypothetical protein
MPEELVLVVLLLLVLSLLQEASDKTESRMMESSKREFVIGSVNVGGTESRKL